MVAQMSVFYTFAERVWEVSVSSVRFRLQQSLHNTPIFENLGYLQIHAVKVHNPMA